MTLRERVLARLDEIEADCQRAWGTEDEARFWLPGDRLVYIEPRWALDVWLPSLRRRAERHRPVRPDWHQCQHCPDWPLDVWPCADFRDLCAEIGIDPQETT